MTSCFNKTLYILEIPEEAPPQQIILEVGEFDPATYGWTNSGNYLCHIICSC